jgi:copper chaperone
MTESTRRDLGLSDKNAGCSCCAAPVSVENRTPTGRTEGVTARYLVEGMTCSHCVTSVAEEIHGIDGVSEVDIRLVPEGASTVTIVSSAPLDPATVQRAVVEAGYRVLIGS